MNPIAHAVLLGGLETLIRDAQGDGPEYETLITIELIISHASDGDFEGALAMLGQLQDELGDAHPLDTGIVGSPVVLN